MHHILVEFVPFVIQFTPPPVPRYTPAKPAFSLSSFTDFANF